MAYIIVLLCEQVNKKAIHIFPKNWKHVNSFFINVSENLGEFGNLINVASLPFTCPCDGFFQSIGGGSSYTAGASFTGSSFGTFAQLFSYGIRMTQPCRKNDVIKLSRVFDSGSFQRAIFIPLKS